MPLENFSLIWRRHHYTWRASNLDLCSVLKPIEQWGFFSVPHLMWNGAFVYNGHLRGPVILTPIAERLTVEPSLPVFTTEVCCGLDSNIQPSACGANAFTHYATAVTPINLTLRQRSTSWMFVKHSLHVDVLNMVSQCKAKKLRAGYKSAQTDWRPDRRTDRRIPK